MQFSLPERLESRELLAISVIGPSNRTWEAVGPIAPINGGVSIPAQTHPVAGAVRAIAVQADDPSTTSRDESQTVYIGTVNGGVWRTTTLDPANMLWEPMTDHLPSASVGAIAISPANPNIVYAGTGRFSSYQEVGSSPVGLFRTTEGNATGKPVWTHLSSMQKVGSDKKVNVFSGASITSIALHPTNENIVLVGTSGKGKGLYRSTDGGQTWTIVSGSFNAPDGIDNNSNNAVDEPTEVNQNDNFDNDNDGVVDNDQEVNLPPGTVTDLVFVPNTDFVYAAVRGNDAIYLSSDGGLTWRNIGRNIPAAPGATLGRAQNIRLALHDTTLPNGAHERILYAGFVFGGKLTQLYRTDDFGTSWTSLSIPNNVHTVGQGAKHFSLAADPTNPQILYMGGDSSGATDPSCNNVYTNFFQGVVGSNKSSVTWSRLQCGAAGQTAPHPDSRDIEFVPGHPEQMLQADDGGIYLLATAANGSRQWKSLNRGLQIAEVTHVAYDTRDNTYFAGLQDNGIVEQQSSSDMTWTSSLLALNSSGAFLKGGDGYSVVADPHNPRVHYTFQNNFKHFYRSEYSAAGVQMDLEPDSVLLSRQITVTNLSPADQAVGAADIPLVANPGMQNNLIVGYNDLYESRDGGKSFTTIEAAAGYRSTVVTAIANGATAAPNVVYVARGNNVAVRTPDAKLNVFTPKRKKGETYFNCISQTDKTVTVDHVGSFVSESAIVGMAVNPNNWEEAYAVDGTSNLYYTFDGGECWRKYEASLGFAANMRSVTIIRPQSPIAVSNNPADPGEDHIVLVGTEQGVYRVVRTPTSPKITQLTRFGSGLPNVVVKDLKYDKADDILYVGTLGRGVWQMTQASTRLPYMTITGSNENDTITLRRDSNDKSKFVVSDGTTTHGPFARSAVDRIFVNGRGGSDTLVIDNRNGALSDIKKDSKFLLINFRGGEDSDGNDLDAVSLLKSTAAKPKITAEVIQSPTYGFAPETGQASFYTKDDNNGVSVLFEQVELDVTSNIPRTEFVALNGGLETAADAIASATAGNPQDLSWSIMGLINGTPPHPPGKVTRTVDVDDLGLFLGDPSFESTPTDTTPFLRRLIETGDAAFSLDDIDESILDATALAAAFEQLDVVPNNVSVTTTTTPEGDVTRFDVGIEKTLFGSQMLDLLALNGAVKLNARVDLLADVKARFVFGLDANGFFFDPNPVDANGNLLGAEFVVRNLRGTIDADARIGFLEATLRDGQLTTDPDARLELNVKLPTTNVPSDGRLRMFDWLERDITELVAVELVGDPTDATPDLAISGSFQVDFFNFAALPSLDLTIEFADIRNLFDGTARPTNLGAGQGILEFLNANIGDITAGLSTLSGAIEQATGVDLLDKQIPLINRSIGDVLGTVPAPVVLSESDGIVVSPATIIADNTQFDLQWPSGDFSELGLETGNTVEYARTSSSGTVVGTIVALTRQSVTVEIANASGELPGIGASFQIQPFTGLRSQLNGYLNGVGFSVPTLQDLVRRLETVTGIPLMDRVSVIGSLGSPDFAIQMPLVLDPDARTYSLPLDFAATLPNLDLDASATAQITVDPRFEITLGVRLSKNEADGTPIELADRIYVVATKDETPPAAGQPQPTNVPVVELDVTARLNDPQIHGRFGFLDVVLKEDVPPDAPADDPSTPEDEDGNQGLDLAVQLSMHLVDAGTITTDQRISLKDLATHLTESVDVDVAGRLDIDGLIVNASIGAGLPLGNVRISLDGDTNGVIRSLDDLLQIVTDRTNGIQIDGDLTLLDNFKNITPEQIFAALGLLVDKLHDLGVGGVLDKPIPGINKSVSELVDLGETYSAAIGQPDSPTSVATAKRLETYLNSRLGAGEVDVIVTADAILFNFGLDHHLSRELPISFSVGNSGISVSGDADVRVDACVGINLTLGISTAPDVNIEDRVFLATADPTNPALTHEVSVRLMANAGYTATFDCGGAALSSQPPLEFAAVAGPLSLAVEAGRALIDLQLGVDLSASNGNRVTFTNLGQASISAQATGTIQAILPLDGNGDGTVAPVGSLSASDARVEIAGVITSLNDVALGIVTDPAASVSLPHHVTESAPLTNAEILGRVTANTVRVETHNLQGLISNSFLNLGTLIDGLEKLLEWLDERLGSDILDRKIPLIGKSIGDGLNFLQSNDAQAKTLRSLIVGIIENRLGIDGTDGLGTNTSTAAVTKALDIIANALLSVDDVHPLVDRNNNQIEDAADLYLTEMSGGSVNGVTYSLKFTPSYTLKRPFDLGLDFLSVSADAAGTIDIDTSLALTLGFGVNKDQGFFVLTNLPGPELQLTAAVATTSEFDLRFGLLDVHAALLPGTNLSAQFTADIASDADGKLTLADLVNTQSAAQWLPQDNLHLFVEAHLRAELETVIGKQLPRLNMGLVADWGTRQVGEPDGYIASDLIHESAQPFLELTNVTLDLGSFVSNLIGPLFQRIQESNLVPQRLIDALNKEIPLIKRTSLDLLEEIIEQDPDSGRRAAFQLIFRIAELIEQATAQANDANQDSLALHFGDFTIINENGQAAGQTELADEDVQVSQQSADNGAPKKVDEDGKNSRGQEVPGSGLPLIGDYLEQLGELGIFFPVLELSNIVQLIVGQDIDLVFIDVPQLEIEKEFNINIPLAGGGIGKLAELSLNAFVGGGFALVANLSGGLDTSGLRQGALLDGLYLGDFAPGDNARIDPTDQERREIEFTGFVQAGLVGQASIAGFEVGSIEGFFRIDASIGVDLNDDNERNGVVPACDPRSPEERHDGKMHFHEMRTVVRSHDNQLLGLLDLTGDITATLGVHIQVLGGLLLDVYESTSFELLDFDDISIPVKCPPADVPGSSCDSLVDEGDTGFGLVFDPITQAYELEIDTQPINETLDAIISLADLNGLPIDGGEIETFPFDELIITDLGDSLHFDSAIAGTDFTEAGVSPGQGVTLNDNGNLSQGIITNVTPTSFTVSNRINIRGAVRKGPVGAVPAVGTITVLDGFETIIVQQGGVVTQIGPSGCGTNQIPDAGEIGSISTTDDQNGLGPGNDTIVIDPKIRIPVKILGGDGDDVIIGGSGPTILLGGPGNDLLEVSRNPFRPSRPTTFGARLEGGSGNDSLRGGPGPDILLGGEGDDDILDGLVGQDRARDPSGNDVVVGGGGRDQISSHDGDDLLVGDYDEALDPRPVRTGDRLEDQDTIEHGTGGKAAIFGDNKGAGPMERGEPADATRLADDYIVARDASDEIFLDSGDRSNVEGAKGTLRLEAFDAPIQLTSKSIQIGDERPILFTEGMVVDISSTESVLSVSGTELIDTLEFQSTPNGTTIIVNDGTPVHVENILQIRINTGLGADTIVFDGSQSNPVPPRGIELTGGVSSGGQDRVSLLGGDLLTSQLVLAAASPQSGVLSVDEREIAFTSVDTLELTQMKSVSWQSPKGADAITVRPTLTADKELGNSVVNRSGVANSVLLVARVASLTIDAGSGDTTPVSDLVSIPEGLNATGLSSLRVLTGSGADTVRVAMDRLTTPTAQLGITIVGGSDADTIDATGNVDYVLNGDTLQLSSSAGGGLALLELTGENVRLTGGAAANRFTVTNWTGTTVVDGSAGDDLLVATLRGGTLTAVDTLTLAGNITANTSGSTATLRGTFALGSASRSINVFDGTQATDMIVDGTLTGTTGISKAGAGTLRLIGNNTYTGTTTITNGTLSIDGNQSTSAVRSSLGTLSGVGPIGSLTGGRLNISPGIDVGILMVRGALALASTDRVQFAIRGLLPGERTGGYDVLDVDGTVNLGSSALDVTFGFSSTPGNTYMIVDNDGTDAITGTFAGLAEGTLFVANGLTLQISYRGGTGNDVVVTHVSNKAPAFPNRSVSPLNDEGGEVTLSGQITEADAGDLFTLEIDWSDGTPLDVYQFDPSLGIDVQVRHRYTQDSSRQPDGVYLAKVLWKDQHGAFNAATMPITVANVAPTITAQAEPNRTGDARFVGAGRFDDPGTDAWSATVDYGDGSAVQAVPLNANHEFSLEHHYATPGRHVVTVTIMDDNGGLAQTSLIARVVEGRTGMELLSWHSFRDPQDVNDSGAISPLDALLIINVLNSGAAGDLSNKIDDFDLSAPTYIDVNGDNFVTALDALLVINTLNELPERAAESELTTPVGHAALAAVAVDQAARRSRSLGPDKDGSKSAWSLVPSDTPVRVSRATVADAVYEQWFADDSKYDVDYDVDDLQSRVVTGTHSDGTLSPRLVTEPTTEHGEKQVEL